jgi:hypothetical protein
MLCSIYEYNQFSIFLLLWFSTAKVRKINGYNFEILITSHREHPQGQSLIFLGLRMHQEHQENSGEMRFQCLLAMNPKQ